MANKMLIDASHPEETRVVVVKGNKVDEFDFEAADRVQLRGNIYLAKVTRVEPSLQAAFVDYGGNRHGFLAFSEIHPDYYQIPVADRQALIAEEQELDEDINGDSDDSTGDPDQVSPEHDGADGDNVALPLSADEGEEISQEIEQSSPDELPEDAPEIAASDEQSDDTDDDGEPTQDDDASDKEAEIEISADADETLDDGKDDESEQGIESVGAEDALEEVPERRRPRRRQYKIQEVIKRRQILLVQVVKEERGNKGAAMTTYLSLAGRYSVLMPNTARGGGISRKITNPSDRKRLKSVANSLSVPEGMGVILRTAGANRTKPEIKRDFEYLLRLWENVRTLTLESSAPSLVYEEGSLIKRSIRDLYSKDIDEVQVAGDDGYREAKDFMKMLMPSHAKNVKAYRNEKSLFSSYNIEPQLDAMFSPQVTLKSGGYLVINPTEALVSIDVNSGKSTREHNIEDTALQTNLEAAEEVARQLRLRDLAGLIVIDFIDMDENRNNRAVERKLKECLKSDRARIQVGRISPFGLLEMSRQRIRTGVLESTTVICEHCEGSGYVRAPASIALQVLRALEDHLIRTSKNDVIIKVRGEVALYILNQKRASLVELESRFGVTILIEADADVSAHGFELVKGEPARQTARPVTAPLVSVDSIEPLDEDDEDEQADADADLEARDDKPRRKRRRRRRRKGSDGEQDSTVSTDGAGENSEAEADETKAADSGADEASESDEDQPKKRRRGKRGGRRNRRRRDEADTLDADEGELTADAPVDVTDATEIGSGEQSAEDRESSVESDNDNTEGKADTSPSETVELSEPVAEKPKRKRTRKTKAQKEAEEKAKQDAQVDADDIAADNEGAEVTSAKDRSAKEADAEPGKPPEAIELPVEHANVVTLDPAPNGTATPSDHRSEVSGAADVVREVEPPAAEQAVSRPRRTGWWRRGSK